MRLQGFVGRALGDPGLKPSVRVGEAAVREVAAFLLDHEHFSSVPHTVFVKAGLPCSIPSFRLTNVVPEQGQSLLAVGLLVYPGNMPGPLFDWR